MENPPWLYSQAGLGRSPGEGKGYLLQYSGLKNPSAHSPWGRKKLDTTERLPLHLLTLTYRAQQLDSATLEPT